MTRHVPGPMMPPRVAPGMRPLILLVLAAIPLAACGRNQPSDRLDDNAVANATPAALTTPAKRCASSATYALIKRELVRRAGEARTNDIAAFQQIAASAVLRVERPVVESDDEGQGGIACSASIALDLPPGVTVSGGRTSLSADLDYLLRPAADGTGDIVTLPRPEAITIPLATLTRPQPAPPRIPILPSATPDSPQPVKIHRETPPDPLAPTAEDAPNPG